MKSFLFGLHALITGIGGASGILYENERILLISDDSYVLYLYSMENSGLEKINIHPGPLLHEGMEKKEKPDFEAIGRDGDFYFIFGSGSADNRYDMVEIDARNMSVSGRYSLEPLYTQIRDVAQMAAENFNIEGVVFHKADLLLFNRGNGPGMQNGVFKIQNWRDQRAREISFFPVKLPQIGGMPMGFTDATLVDDTIYFVSSVEDSISTYDDGEVLGSGIGKLSLRDFTLQDFQIVTHQYKLEGIAFLRRTLGRTSFLVCEDADDGIAETKVFNLDLID